MDAQALADLLEQNPVIAAVRDRALLSEAAECQAPCVFLLAADVLHLDEDMAMLRECGKQIFIHMDLVTGLGRDAAGIRYLARNWQPAGILSTHQSLLRCAQEVGLLSIQRVFLMDSYAINSGLKLVRAAHADFIEVMPGLIPKAIRRVREQVAVPIIAGGMISEKEDVLQALNAGALAVSTGTAQLWNA